MNVNVCVCVKENELCVYACVGVNIIHLVSCIISSAYSSYYLNIRYIHSNTSIFVNIFTYIYICKF